MQVPQYHWHSVTTVGSDVEAWERLVALEWKVFAFGNRQRIERWNCWPKLLSWKRRGAL